MTGTARSTPPTPSTISGRSDLHPAVQEGPCYKKETTVNYCTGCKVVLANEEVVNGVCERCGSPVVQKNKSQWMLKITAYADRLINDLDDVDYIDRVKTSSATGSAAATREIELPTPPRRHP